MDVNTQCPRCAAKRSSIVRDGFFSRADDSKRIQRFQCKECGKKFSAATGTATYRQKKRRCNYTIKRALAFNMCQRDIAALAGVNVKTVAARLVWQATLSRKKNEAFVADYIKKYGPIEAVQFDDLITFEHTKLKQLTVPVLIIEGTRVPLAFDVASIPTSGHLASIAREKYGKRADDSVKAREGIFEKQRDLLPDDVCFTTDAHSHYATLIKHYFPNATHKVYKSKPAAVVGLGELRENTWDPLFTINHFLAYNRAKINRLNRRTWCTTKDPARLADHISVLIDCFCDYLQERWKRNIGVCPVVSTGPG